MTEIDSTLDPFVEAEIKERHAALIRQMVLVAQMPMQQASLAEESV
jgi:hypothetical protein